MKIFIRKLVILFTVSLFVISTFQLGYTAEKKTIKFWIYGGAEVRDPIKKVCDDFEKLHPDIAVDVQVFADWPDLNRKALLALAGGDQPDIIRGKPQLLADFAEKGALEPLDDYIKKERINTALFVDILFQKSAKYKGKTYAFPFHATAPALLYNTELFKAAGLKRAPNTWDETVEFAKKLTIPEKKQWGLYPPQIFGVDIFILHLWQNGGKYMNDDYTKFLFNSPEGLEALQWEIDLMHKYKVTPPMDAQTNQDIYQGKVGMWITYSELRAVYQRDYPNLKFASAIFPKKLKRTSMDMCSGLMIFSASKVKKETWELLKFLCLNEDNQRYIMSQASYLPVTKKVLMSPPFYTDPFLKPFVWQLLHDIDARPIIPGADEMRNKLQQELQEAWFLRKPPEKALSDAEKAMTEIYSQVLSK